jgi:exosortase H (IPTLxxWG-CTERM-specific)
MRIVSLPQGFNLRFTVIMTLYGGAVFLDYRHEVLGPVLAPLSPWTAYVTQVLLHQLGIDAVRHGAVLAHPNGFAYQVGYICIGFTPIIMFIGCVLAYPGTWQVKRMGIALGIPLLWLLNLVRLVHLFYLGVYIPKAFTLAHEIVWQGLQAVTFIALWLSWIRWSDTRVHPITCHPRQTTLRE